MVAVRTGAPVKGSEDELGDVPVLATVPTGFTLEAESMAPAVALQPLVRATTVIEEVEEAGIPIEKVPVPEEVTWLVEPDPALIDTEEFAG